MKMKRLVVTAALLLTMAVSVFAASTDMTPLAVVKLNGSETITVKTLKDRVNLWTKLNGVKEPSLANIAGTMALMLGFNDYPDGWNESLIKLR